MARPARQFPTSQVLVLVPDDRSRSGPAFETVWTAMAAFFTADTHFGDAHVLRQRRQFADLGAHDSLIVDRWNAVVGPDDDVWHVGDFAAHASRDYCEDIFRRLNGRKRLVRGNHDSNRVLELPWVEPPCESCRLTVADATGTEHRLFLAHYAHRAWPGLWRDARHLYGHTHGRIPDTIRSCDVGVDAWDFRPVGLDDVLARQAEAALVPDELVLRDQIRSAGRQSP